METVHSTECEPVPESKEMMKLSTALSGAPSSDETDASPPTSDLIDQQELQRALLDPASADDAIEINKQIVTDRLEDLGVASVTIAASGGGDDGQIDDCDLFNKNGEPMDPKILHGISVPFHEYDTWKNTKSMVTKSLEDALHDLIYEILGHGSRDWVNNEGSDSEIVIDCIQKTITGTIELYHIDSTLEGIEF